MPVRTTFWMPRSYAGVRNRPVPGGGPRRPLRRPAIPACANRWQMPNTPLPVSPTCRPIAFQVSPLRRNPITWRRRLAAVLPTLAGRRQLTHVKRASSDRNGNTRLRAQERPGRLHDVTMSDPIPITGAPSVGQFALDAAELL